MKKLEELEEQGIAAGVFPFYTNQALAQRWGVERRVVNNWSKRHVDFCKPVLGLIKGGGPYYPLHEIIRYEKKRGFTVYE